MNKNARYLIFILFGVAVILMLMGGPANVFKKDELESLTFSQFKQLLTPEGKTTVGRIFSRTPVEKNEDTSFMLRISPRRITGRYLKPGVILEASDTSTDRIKSKTIPFEVEVAQGAMTEKVQQLLDENAVVYKFENPDESSLFNTIIQILPFVLLIGFLWMFMMRQIQATGNRAMSFGKSKARLLPEGKKKLTFGDVAGCDEAKMELVEVVEFLKDPKKFQSIGAKIPKGVLLVGPPGTGKTLLARAVAGEAGVPFFSISGSDFVEMFVGVGASRVRDLFEQAKRQAPCIVFIDEIDAVGRLRGAGLGGGHDEREQTLNQMLVEMDGFEENEGIIVVAATNRPDVLDPALLRPGRFDRQVVVDIPDVKGREAILKIHAKKIPLTSDVSLQNIARGTPGFTGADLANLINEAALLAARRNKRRVTQEELEEAKDKVLMGPERKSFMITQKEKEVIAYHEGGHALLGTMLAYAEPVHKVTIIPRGRALGLTQQLPEDDKHIQPSKYWLDRICVLMGGLLAEEIIFEDRSTGASNDIQVATNIARRMVCEWGMSEKIGTINYSSNHDSVFLGREIQNARQYSDETATIIDEEVHRIIVEQKEKGKALILQHREKLERIAKALLSQESITGDELSEMVGEAASENQKRSARRSREDREGREGGGITPEPAPAT
ncbi:MAG: ATP-dependent zinc metalloprotease FtsH [Spirochaetia bacterium]|nr:ATP-dependent zinc metalloprotease FtsH [Spirochaetia bacterium]